MIRSLGGRFVAVFAAGFVLVALCLSCDDTSAAARPPRAKLAMGINLAGVADWQTQWVFVDVFKHSRAWIPQRAGDNTWDTGEAIELDPQGWPLLKPGQAAATIMCREINGHYPAGVYVCTFEGTGVIEFHGDAISSRSSAEHRYDVTVRPGNDGILLKIVASDRSNPVRNIRLTMPGFDQAMSAFHPLFIERLKPFKTIRFMNFAGGNNDPTTEWSQRTTPASVRQSGAHGVAIEHMIDLCNELAADPWLCMPYRANDDYIRNYAQLVRARLHQGARIYIEWSNETWNTLFDQGRWVNDQAKRRGIISPHVTAQEAARVWRIWQDVFGDQKHRIVRVAAGQHYNPWVADEICNALNGEFDAVSCAMYFAPSEDDAAKLNSSTTPAQLLEISLDNVRNKDIPLIDKHRKIADRWSANTGRSIRLIAYEGGPHIIPIAGFGAGQDHATSWEQSARLVHRNPGMFDVYREMLTLYERAGGELFMAFTYCEQPGKWGSWGALEFQDQPIDQAPKYRALAEFIDRR